MVLRKNSSVDLPEFMGTLVFPPFTYRPVVEPGMEIPVAYQPGEYSSHGYYRIIGINTDGFVSGTVLSIER
jgi:hypothetical protein